MTTPPRMRIGEVHALLREEFPSIELSKIRYYEDKGLVRPARSRKGYRLYGPEDVACLREAFRLAQDEFMPLKVIRQRLIDKGLLTDARPVVHRVAAQEHATPTVTVAAPVSAPHAAPAAPATPALRVVRDVDADRASPVAPSAAVRGPVAVSAAPKMMSRDEFAAAAQLDVAVLQGLVDHGLLRPMSRDGRCFFEPADLDVVAQLRPLLARGVEPRLLQPLARVVDRQVDLVAQLTMPLRLHGERAAHLDVDGEAARVSDEVELARRALLARAFTRH